MLKVQEFLNKYGLEKLESKYQIKVTRNDYDDRILLNYNQLDKEHKTSPITRECRGLCLDKNNFSLISRGFYRFFNLGEWRADDNKFDWNDCISQEKVDGTFLNVFYYKGRWRVCTRGSFGDIPLYPDGPTPEQLFNNIIGNATVFMDTRKTHIFELCSRHNKIVRDYPTDTLFLLSMFDGETELPLDYVESERDGINGKIGKIQTPDRFNFKSAEEVIKFIQNRSEQDKTFEGIIVRDKDNNRLKIKNPDYLILHRLKGEDNSFHPKNLIKFVLSGETDELFAYFPETKPKVGEMQSVLDSEFRGLQEAWERLKYSATRKDFAIGVPPNLKTKSLLFRALDTGLPLSQLWSESEDLLLKLLF